MQYCAKVNTADPRIGFISVGEVLTDEQARALGEEKLNELTARGVLAAHGSAPKADSPAEISDGDKSAETPAEPEKGDADDGEDDGDGEDDELPELDITDDIVFDKAGEEPKKREGRSKK